MKTAYRSRLSAHLFAEKGKQKIVYLKSISRKMQMFTRNKNDMMINAYNQIPPERFVSVLAPCGSL